ncbi:MAG: N-acetylmuramoyl-L-alanine amidase, partial [Deltaproteobacteria bacterium]|nr:N-acetylmuramoyl-L-alanine amidase [Deltaproteobacteria bacterium]
KELKAKTGAKVYLTRSSDQALTLDERAQFGEQKKADLFLSIHANASPSPKLAGIQTFYLNNATDEAAAKLALRENRAAGKSVSEVEHILSTMTQTASTEESKLLADDVQAAMIKRMTQHYPHVNDLRVHGALFYVLTGAKCPSILVETSFLSNQREERRLANATYQQHLAEAIVAGVQRYVATKDKRLQSL